MCSGLITVLLMSRGAHPGKKRSPSSAPGPGSSAPSHLHVQAEQIWVWKRRASWLNTETVSLISFSKMKASGDFTLSQNVCLSWQLEPCGRGTLQAACTASPQGRSPCPAFLGTHPSHQQLSQAGGKRRPPLALRGALKAPDRSLAQLLAPL